MARMYNTYLGRLLLGLLILIALENESGKDQVAAVVGRYQPSNESDRRVVATALDYYLRDYGEESPKNEDVLKGTLGQLSKKKTEDADLLDTVVNLLRLPYANYLGGGVLKALRDAILTPSELTEIKQSIKATLKCGCGHEFQSGEMVTFSPSNEGPIATCNACQRPSYIRCDYCQDVTVISSTVSSKWRNEVDCGCRKRKELETAQTSTANAAAAQLRFIRRARQRLETPVPTPAATPPRPLDPMQIIRDAGIVGNPFDDDGGF